MRISRFRISSWQYELFAPIVGLLPLNLRIRLLYLRRFRRIPRFNHPQSFNEKINWRKLHQQLPIHVVASDKLASKDLVKQLAPELKIPEVLWRGDSFEDLDSSELPDRCVIKANHGSGMNVLVSGGRFPPIEELERMRAAWFRHDQSRALGEWAYGGVHRQVFVEEFLGDEDVPNDFKVFVFHGRAEFIQVDSGRFSDHHRNTFTRDWVDIGYTGDRPRLVPPPERPIHLAEMVSAAEKIGSEFDFVRVDLYSLPNGIYFGELTVYPGAGFGKYNTHVQDVDVGRLWKIRSG